ncbi:MAG: carbohydrate binding family 9 domain-containing protein [Gemmatimonadetes bacterium]|nr:carbohydrate binding family 9 domain-containing protein [Gemmatimonadota bacterium]
MAAPRNGEIRIDGYLEEEAWVTATAAQDFIQQEPFEGMPAAEPTEVRVLYDGQALYVGARMYDSEPHRIADQLVRRDEWGQYDYFEVSLDPNQDRRTGYQFRVSAAGVQADAYLYDDVRSDDSWDAVWQSAVARDSLGWTAEIRIPLSQIRYEAAHTTQTWGVNFSRRRLASNERTFFALESRRQHGRVSAFGRLDGMSIHRGARRFEFRPYALAGARTAPATEGNPFFDGSDGETRAGLDLRYGLGAAFTLDATLNPDFGQVEVDPAVINLTAFETFFPEKRPFFVEDAQIFQFTLSGHENRLFYSRRVGREPQGEAPEDSDFEDSPSQSTILGAAKLTGRTSGGLSTGVLAALTDRERGRAHFADPGRTESFLVQPRAQHGVVRLQQDFRGGSSQVGAIFTGMHRDLPSDRSFDFLTSSAYNAGIDFEHNWGGPRGRDWALWGFFAGSLVKGPPEALIRIQEASNHYFQRPDATRLSLDSMATSLAGYEWRLQFERRSAEHWTWSVWAAEVSPGFEINDLGFSRSAERLDGGARIGYHEITPGRLFRGFRVNASTFQNWSHEWLDDPFSSASWERAHKAGSFNLNGDFMFLNYWSLDLSVRYTPELMSPSSTRGGPLMLEPRRLAYSIRGSSDRRAVVSLEPSLDYQEGFGRGSRFETGLEISIRPSPSVQLELEPEYSREVDPAQYAGTAADAGYRPTFGRRYLFADLERRSFSLQTRLNVAFSPKLSLQVYTQPLFSAGDYLTYKQLMRPRSFEFDVFAEGTAREASGAWRCAGGRTCAVNGERYVDFGGDGVADFSFDDQDFNIRSLRGNAVLRWEYRPGSTLFLVWQQSRRSEVNDGTFALGSDMGELFRADAENIFILKVNYWLGL